MIEIGKDANDNFVRKNFQPRTLEVILEEMEPAATDEENVAAWKASHNFQVVNPRGNADDVQKAIADQQAQEESARRETMREWQRRTEYLAGKAQADAQEIPPAETWVSDRIAKIYGGGNLAADIATLKARLASGTDMEELYDETNSMLHSDYARGVELKRALAYVDAA